MVNLKPLVLIIEDEAMIRMGAVDFVVEAGFEALEASDADEAIRILEARRDIHLVFTDVGLPGTMDGLRLCHYIKDRWPPVRLIVASGQTLVDEGDLPPGARFFAKPYSDHDIVEAMSNMLAEAKVWSLNVH